MEQIRQVCRLCLVASWDATSSMNNAEMVAQLKVIFKFEFHTDGTLPQAICFECSSKVSEFHSFHESVRVNQSLLLTSGPHEEKVFVAVEAEGYASTSDVGKEEVFRSQEEELLLATAIKTELIEVDEEPENETKNEPDSSGEEINEAIHPDDTTFKSKKRIRKTKPADLTETDLKIISFLGSLKCNSCTETFETFNRLKRHCSKVHGTKGAVTCCNRSFDVKHKFVEHIDSHSDPMLLYCKICDKYYKNKMGLDLHNQMKHSEADQNPFECDQCNQRFPKECMLNAHLKTHVKVQCSVCNRLMANHQSLRAHMLLIHAEVKPVKPGHMCDLCGRTFHTKPDLKKHINRHQGITEERLQCSICLKWLATKSSLNLHIQTAHRENERVACEICNKIVLKHVLTSHKRKVHGKKKFECNICGKTFLLSRYLKEHQTAHEGKRMYSCNFCGHMTNYSTNLHTHMKTKHPEEWIAAKARGDNMVASAEVDDTMN